MKLQPTKADIAEWSEDFPDLLKRKFLKGFSGTKSKVALIHAKCVDCSGYDGISGIRDCTVMRCPLRPVRPYKHKGE